MRKCLQLKPLQKAAHLIDMNDIIREGHPTLRAIAEEVSFPLSDQEIILGEKNDAVLAPFAGSCHGRKIRPSRWSWSSGSSVGHF